MVPSRVAVCVSILALVEESYFVKQDLPPGQRAIDHFPRFGLIQFAERFPRQTERVELTVGGEVEHDFVLTEADLESKRVEQVSDFHCVTTWTRRNLAWSGFPFRQVYEDLVVPRASATSDARWVILRGQDGYRACMRLDDLLRDDVLLADRLDGTPLSIAHGAPIRLVAPQHYGYKSVKHVHSLRFVSDLTNYRTSGLTFMEHQRARVAHEERGRGVPGWILRLLYRPLIERTARRFEDALRKHGN